MVRHAPVAWPPALLLVVLLTAPGANAHLAAVCTATHAHRPQAVTFMFATYHKAPYEGALVPGEAHIRTPEGQVFDFPFTSFCEVPHDGSSNEYPVPAWPLDSNVSFYRDRLRQHCVCSLVLGCGTFNPTTGRCTSTDGDCPLVDPLLQEIECYGKDSNVPPSKGAWARQLADDEDGNCAYGSKTGVDFPSWARTWYTAQLTGIYSGIFEVWSTGTDHNLDPSSLCVVHGRELAACMPACFFVEEAGAWASMGGIRRAPRGRSFRGSVAQQQQHRLTRGRLLFFVVGCRVLPLSSSWSSWSSSSSTSTSSRTSNEDTKTTRKNSKNTA
jgi:hypothetical protein